MGGGMDGYACYEQGRAGHPSRDGWEWGGSGLAPFLYLLATQQQLLWCAVLPPPRYKTLLGVCLDYKFFYFFFITSNL